jgi:hypothetical protein
MKAVWASVVTVRPGGLGRDRKECWEERRKWPKQDFKILGCRNLKLIQGM